MDEDLMRSFSAIQAPLSITQMFDFLLQYAVRINALWGQYRNFSFENGKKASDFETKIAQRSTTLLYELLFF